MRACEHWLSHHVDILADKVEVLFGGGAFRGGVHVEVVDVRRVTSSAAANLISAHRSLIGCRARASESGVIAVRGSWCVAALLNIVGLPNLPRLYKQEIQRGYY